MKRFWKDEKPPETERIIRANNASFNNQFNYAKNHISTSKYNIFTFLPKNLFEQFQRLANAYFLGLMILQFTPISSLTYLTTVIPLVLVLLVTATKDAVDDFIRHRSDAQVNNRKSDVLREGELSSVHWHTVVVGDIIRLKNNDFVAADLMLLSTSEPNSLCYIETAELDGETNLKVKEALPDTAEMHDDMMKMGEFDAEITCEPPNVRLNKFDGRMMWNGETYALDNDNVLLRGCVLRNTHWCYGLVIFAGSDTKLMMNSGKAAFKRTHIDRLLNVLIIGIFLFLLSLCLICTIACGIFEAQTGYGFEVFLPRPDYVSTNKDAGSTSIAVLVFFSYIIILNTVVPISLYVTVEIIRLVNSMWINWDNKMYYEKKDTPAKARTTTLSEELGQIEYIFSDKTGTLTQNIMTFNRATIDLKRYGDVTDDMGNIIDITENTPRVDFSENKYAEKTFAFYDPELIQAARGRNPDVEAFFRLLSLCHTIMPETKEDGSLEYQAQSPDEGALVSAARNFGYVFKSRTPSSITIEVHGKEEVYELLCILDFNNVRKRMSVLVRKDGELTLYCKGADSVIFERLDPKCEDLKQGTLQHLNAFAQLGLRTLCCSSKVIDEEYYNAWKRKHHEASTSLENRDDKLDAVYDEIEQNMTLLGASAIEDKLQDGVPEAIANLALAGIKIWVLTGDKQETAINIGYSCRLLTEEMGDPFIIAADSYEGVEQELSKALNDIQRITSSRQKNDSDPPDENGGFAIVINGHSLAYALRPGLEMLLLDVGSLCKAVICCRVTPLQKALVVDLVKQHKKSVTLAIGDGANDVSMIKMAHIGVGISGQEGMQAVLSSDFSMAQFRYLERLLLVHGRWSYIRMCKFLRYFFYKNFAFTLCHFWFAFFCGFSAQTLYDPFFITCYNVFYTSLPVIAMGVFDQDVNEEYSIRYPRLYEPGLKDAMFNKEKFVHSVLEGILSSAILFFVPYATFFYGIGPDGRTEGDLQSFGCAVGTILVVAVNLRCAVDISYWTGFNHLVVWGSIVFYFCFIMAFYAGVFKYTYVGVALEVFSTSNFWFSLILTCAILILPVITYRYCQSNFNPTLADKVRLIQRTKKVKSVGMATHRRSTTRHKFKSQRSGYAFAHQRGFGDLITTGRAMHDVHPGTYGAIHENGHQSPATATENAVSGDNNNDSNIILEKF